MQTTVINCPMCGGPMYITEVSAQGHTWKCWSCGYVEYPQGVTDYEVE